MSTSKTLNGKKWKSASGYHIIKFALTALVIKDSTVVLFALP